MNTTIDSARLKRLLEAEEKLQALEAAGVDSWDYYDEAMRPIRQREERREAAEEVVDDIAAILAVAVYEPSERGAGYAFSDDAIEEAVDLLVRKVKEFNV